MRGLVGLVKATPQLRTTVESSYNVFRIAPASTG